VPQVLEALFTCLRLQEDRWTARNRPLLVRRAGAPPAFPESATPIDGAGYGKLFREGLAALGGMLAGALGPDTLGALCAAAAADGPPDIPDDLWTRVVVELAAAHRHATLSRDHLAQAAVPLYLGRVASLGRVLAGLDARTAADRLEALCQTFERSRSDLVALWTAPAR
jgi:hypothetical protein